ncbi:MAG: hypothetical protein NC238_00050 [Dehalobacter sp.]|nr:hypothetical protein [Dehalobacter sp.]
MIDELNETLLQHFISTFYGSGNYSGDYWFIGMEEGGGNDLDQVTKRLNAWVELGETELVDIYQFHGIIGFPQCFKDPVKLQRTWMQQARIVLASKGLPSATPDVRVYQRDLIGRKTGETCLVELLPLPSPSLNHWGYNLWSSLPFLKDRKTYRDYCVPWRAEHIRTRIEEYKPKVVVFMGQGYSDYWHTIAGQKSSFTDKGGFLAANSEDTKYIITKHPAAFGITNAYFETIGNFFYQALQ